MASSTMRLPSRNVVWVATVCVFGGVSCRASAPDRGRHVAVASATALSVMSFNLRLDVASDGPNAWPHRRDWVAALIRFHEADVVGVQEALAHMLTELETRLPGFARIGVGRTDGRSGGEFSAILYRTDRVELLDSGTFWLSPTPEVAGSKGWDAAIERIATWGRFRDRENGCRYIHLNTHFDHIGEQARQESARLIRVRLAALSGGLPVIVTGDLNANPTSAPYRIFTRDSIASGLAPLRDAHNVSRDAHYGPGSTWTAFRAIEPGQRIDYVFVSEPIIVRKHGVLTDRWDDRFPSDHLPVLASIETTCR